MLKLNLSTLSFIINLYLTTGKPLTDFSTKFPKAEDALEFIHLSYAVQEFTSCEEIEAEPTFPNGAKCEYYRKTVIGTEAMVVTSRKNKYIGVLFGGSDELRDWIVDCDIKKVPFGPPEVRNIV